MSLRIDTSELISGALVIGETGLGVRGDAVPSTGASGAPPLYNDISLPSEAADEFRALLVTVPAGGTFFMWEDSSFTATGYADGSYSGTYTGFKNGTSYGTATYSFTIGQPGSPAPRRRRSRTSRSLPRRRWRSLARPARLSPQRRSQRPGRSPSPARWPQRSGMRRSRQRASRRSPGRRQTRSRMPRLRRPAPSRSSEPRRERSQTRRFPRRGCLTPATSVLSLPRWRTSLRAQPGPLRFSAPPRSCSPTAPSSPRARGPSSSPRRPRTRAAGTSARPCAARPSREHTETRTPTASSASASRCSRPTT